jgi:hypothetical protein
VGALGGLRVVGVGRVVEDRRVVAGTGTEVLDTGVIGAVDGVAWDFPLLHAASSTRAVINPPALVRISAWLTIRRREICGLRP